MQVLQESFVLKNLRSDRLSLIEKVKLYENASSWPNQRSEAVESVLRAEVKKAVEPLDARAGLKLWEDSGYNSTVEFEVIPKIVQGSLTYDEVVACLANRHYYYPLLDALMGLVDWKSVPKGKLMRTLGRSDKERVWEWLVLKLEIFSEAEILELCTGHWQGKWQKNNFLHPFAKFRELALASPLVSKPEKLRIATEYGAINAEKAFEIVLKHTDFSDKELLEVAESGKVCKCWSRILPRLKKYRNLLKVARHLRTDEAWDIFIEKANLEQKKPGQILRVARVSGYPKIWSLYFKKAAEPTVTHEEMIQRGTQSRRHALWAVFLDHLDYSKLTLDWITQFIQGCACTTEQYRSLHGVNEQTNRLRENFDAAMVLCNKLEWGSVPYEKRLELFRMYQYNPWQEVIADSFETVKMSDFISLSRDCQGKVVEILQSKVI